MHNDRHRSQYQRDLSSVANRLNEAQELVRQELIEVSRLTELLSNITLSTNTKTFKYTYRGQEY